MPASILDAKVEVKTEESEEEAEGEYDDDDQVIVPWGVVTQAEAVQVKEEAAEGEEEEAEGVYSDDECVQGETRFYGLVQANCQIHPTTPLW